MGNVKNLLLGNSIDYMGICLKRINFVCPIVL